MKHRVLVVDDESSIRSSLRMILQHAGYFFSEAASGQEGLEKIAAEDPDVVILDVKMPGMDGLDVLEALRRGGTQIPVLVVSGHGDIETAVRATKLGAFNFIEKPFGEERVLVEIRNALEQRRLKRKADALELEYEKQFELVGESRPMKELRESIQRAAPTHATVLITGESGTGKELVARAIHRNSPRRDSPFIRVNCAAIPEDLIESELFGHERGSFTGASARQVGKFQQADRGTIFLDEVGDMSARTQAKVLRALETGEIEPVGAARVITVDVRVIAATNKDLAAEIRNGRFREDLYFRLAVLPIECPPLRRRAEDVPLLIEHFCANTGRRFSGPALQALSRQPWKGNVRELRNTVERLTIMAPATPDSVIELDALPRELRGEAPATGGAAPAAATPAGLPATLKDFKEAAEKDFILAMLERYDWNISRTAKEIDTPRSNLYKKLEQYGIAKDRMPADEGGPADDADPALRRADPGPGGAGDE
ncbi:MAG TPA: sigma-54 dependent transcriptional regulator [Candidatus Polarisedimenticolia bacterium]|nr:sigma-54 dependent transcriptional regulator [Candidatus Polarisedimenticolia bacterium]